MFCEKCGSPIKDDEKFCGKCGNAIMAYADGTSGAENPPAKSSAAKMAVALYWVGATLFALAGCSPEELELSIKTSAISKAVNGSYGMATATVSFAVEDNSAKVKLSQIRAAALPYLGADGKMTIRGDKITAKFKVPVIADLYIGNIPEKPLAKLVLKGNVLKFEPTSRLDALNSDLRDIDFSIGVDFKAKHVVFKMLGDGDAKCQIKATAVFIDGEAKVNYIGTIGEDDSIDIEFRCNNEASVYHQIQPFVEIVK